MIDLLINVAHIIIVILAVALVGAVCLGLWVYVHGAVATLFLLGVIFFLWWKSD